jgi:NADPH:quinone reductase-like Zn-dependent oxidoreductase
MLAVTIERQGAPVAPNITVTPNWPEDPAPGPGRAVVRTLASALNHMDIWVGMGIPGVDLTYPRISGCDVCGEIESVGPDVDPAWIGRRVIMNAAMPIPVRPRPGDPPASTLAPDYQLIGEHTHGAHRARFTAPVDNLADVGADADPILAAAFGLTALTAYSMMITKGTLRPGQAVLITGIGGGVATSALAIAKWMACPVIVTSRSPEKLERAKAIGADAVIHDIGQDWSKDVRAWTNKRGVDMAVDSIGKPVHLNCIKSLARGGALVTPGNTGGPKIESDQARIFWNQLRVLGSTMGTSDEFREVAALFRAGRLAPVVDSVIPAKNARAAWERLEAADQFGKIVLDWRG